MDTLGKNYDQLFTNEGRGESVLLRWKLKEVIY